MISKRKARMI